MPRAARVIVEDDPVAEPVTETVTYVPGEGDPAYTKWAGQTFQANVPKELIGHADGTPQQKLNLHIIDSVKNGNKSFTLGGQKPKGKSTAAPKTADEYKSYFVDWLSKVNTPDSHIRSADALIARFAQDHQLQDACEVGADDFAYLGGLFMPRLHELAKGDELTEQQVAGLWLQHGVNQLPW